MTDDITDYNTYEYPSSREIKLTKRRNPRGRRIINQAHLTQSIKTGQEKKIRQAKSQIGKILVNFQSLKEKEREKQKEIYLRWLRDSLNNNSPIIDDGDLRLDTAIASVGAGGQNLQKTRTSVRLTHLPTRIAVRNEEERSFTQNRENALNHLKLRLTEHLNYWQILNQNLPAIFSVSEINRLGRQILELFEGR